MESRTNAARSASTRRALSEAATELLIERGWAATTSVAVCDRAGLTRGALMHHYPSLSALLSDALELLYADLSEPSRLSSASSSSPTLRGITDRLWEAIGDPRFKAVIESWLAAANDPELAVELDPAIQRFAALVSPEKQNLRGSLKSPEVRGFLFMARESMFGLALGRSCNGGKPVSHERTVLTFLRRQASEIDARRVDH